MGMKKTSATRSLKLCPALTPQGVRRAYKLTYVTCTLSLVLSGKQHSRTLRCILYVTLSDC